MADNSTDNKIPVLTEIYQPKTKPERATESAQDFKSQASKQANDPTLGITPEFIARVTNHVKPRLEADITHAVIEGLKDAIRKDVVKDLQIEIIKMQATIEGNIANFVDKTKADLKTELPRMFQNSAELVHSNLSERIATLQTAAVTKVDRMLTDVMQSTTQTAANEINTYVEAVKTDATTRIQHELNQELQALQNDALQQHQTQLANDLNGAYQSIKQTSEQDMQQQMQAMQAEAITQIRHDLSAELPAINTALADQVKTQVEAFNTEENTRIKQQLNAEMQAFHDDSLQAYQTKLNEEFIQTYQNITQAAEQDLQQQVQTLQSEALVQISDQVNQALPSIYASVADEVKAKVDALNADENARIKLELAAGMQVFHDESLQQHQAKLAEDLANTYQTVTQNAADDLQQQLQSIQSEALNKVSGDLNQAMPSIYVSATDEMKAKFVEEMSAESTQVRQDFLSAINGDLPAVQEVLHASIEQLLATKLPTLEADLRRQLTEDLKALLLTVKFVLP